MAVQVFVRVPHSWCGASVDGVLKVADEAEALGFEGISVQDHILSSSGVAPCGHWHDGDDRTMMDSLTTLAYLAARTSRIKLLTSVIVLPYRNIVWLAKMGASLDLLSGGRLILGVGVGAPRDRQTDGNQNMGTHAAISSRETSLFDLPGPRGKIMDESLEALNILWTEDSASYDGEYIRFDDVDLVPKPSQKPRPPIWVGGRADAAIRRAATLAEGWFPSQASVATIAAGREQALTHAIPGKAPTVFGVNIFTSVDRDGDAARQVVTDALGRRFRTEEGMRESTISGSPDDVLQRMSEYVDAGCTVFDLKILPHSGDAVIEQMRLVAEEIMPRLHEHEAKVNSAS